MDHFSSVVDKTGAVQVKSKSQPSLTFAFRLLQPLLSMRNEDVLRDIEVESATDAGLQSLCTAILLNIILPGGYRQENVLPGITSAEETD